MAVDLVTQRLTVEPLGAEQLPEALDVYLSRPEYVRLVEGSAGEPGHFDLGMLERDWAIARITPGRVLAAIRMQETGELVGLLDWIDANPTDGVPWIGLVLVAPSHERRGYAREVVAGLIEQRNWLRVRAGVSADNVPGLALARTLGFERYAEVQGPSPATSPTVLLERRQ